MRKTETIEVPFRLDQVDVEDNQTLILAFTDIKYITTTRIWFQRMKFLGYSNLVRFYALDNLALRELQKDVESGLLQGSQVQFRQEYALKYLKKEPRSDFYKPDLRKIWKYRVQVTYQLLQLGHTVMLTDVDSLWMKYRLF